MVPTQKAVYRRPWQGKHVHVTSDLLDQFVEQVSAEYCEYRGCYIQYGHG